jgi:hypothetical protein
MNVILRRQRTACSADGIFQSTLLFLAAREIEFLLPGKVLFISGLTVFNPMNNYCIDTIKLIPEGL